VVAGVVAVVVAAALAAVLAVVGAVPVDAPETVPPKSPMSLANAALRSARVSAETLDGVLTVPDVEPLLPKSLMSAVSSATMPR
jgi:hypothetical protein